MLPSAFWQRLFGILLFLAASGLTAWSWYTALNEGYYYRKAVAFFPAFAMIGLALLLFPLDKERLQAEHGVLKPQKWAHLPLAWQVMLVFAVLAGLGNLLAISRL